jgi:UDP-N-acetylglucosamine:LPS N-acetylglucosamine transferase
MSAKPLVAAIDMGYGHLRPAAALADHLGTQVLQMDRPPLGNGHDLEFWDRTRDLYEPLTRFSQLPGLGPPMRALLNTITAIPAPWPARDLSGPTPGTRWMERAAREGVGELLAQHLRKDGAPLMTTFYAAAILAELHGASRLYCLVTDSDINRVWAPPAAAKSGIRYFVPTDRARRRMESYGVPRRNIRVTGYPLPGELVGKDRAALEKNFRERMERLSGRGEPPLIVFAVGGAGAQVPLAKKLVGGMARQLREGSLRLTLVAGRRPEVAKALRDAVYAANVEVEVVEDPDVFGYIKKLNDLLARADALWSKPSELTFFAALGLPFISAPPVGVHEQWNLRFGTDHGAALPQHDPGAAGEWLREWVEDGVLASAAEAGRRLPSGGLYEIAEELEKA